MQLRGQVPEEVGHIPHGSQLERGVETDLREAQEPVVRSAWSPDRQDT